tara:strand:- start:149 stop:352 length:204 start_codon:yes stop_codon:yes gene_type:complete
MYGILIIANLFDTFKLFSAVTKRAYIVTVCVIFGYDRFGAVVTLDYIIKGFAETIIEIWLHFELLLF